MANVTLRDNILHNYLSYLVKYAGGGWVIIAKIITDSQNGVVG